MPKFTNILAITITSHKLGVAFFGKEFILMIAKAFRVAMALWLVGGWAMMVEAQDVDQSSEDQAIVGSKARTARQGYSHKETLWHLSNIDHRRWDVKADETMRFLHLNGPQFFTHAWVHRAGPISELETKINTSTCADYCLFPPVIFQRSRPQNIRFLQTIHCSQFSAIIRNWRQ